MNEQKIKSFLITMAACFLGCYLALVFFNTQFDFGKIFQPKPAAPAVLVAAAPPTPPAPPIAPVSQEQQALRELYKSACKDEIGRICSKAGSENVIPCLLDLDTVNPVCKNSLAVFTERFKPCEAEIRNLCPGLKFGGGRIQACLKKNKDKISSPACQQVIL